MLPCKITLPDSPHPIFISKNPRFWGLYLAKRNELRFFRLIITKLYIYIYFHFWLLALPKKFRFCPKNNGFARVRGGAATPPAPWLIAYDVDVTMTSQIIIVLPKIVKTEGRIVFWLLVCTANINNCKPAWLQLGDYRELHTIELIAHRHTVPSIYTMQALKDAYCTIRLMSLK